MTAPLLRGEVEEEVRALSSSDREAIRLRAKTDLYFLARGILGYEKMTVHTHKAACDFIVRSPKHRRLFLMPRGHYKSTFATIGDAIRLSLVDVDAARILIVNETSDNAEGFLSEIKGHWENNSLLRDLFPELVPEKFTGPGAVWGAAKANLRRTTAWKEATYNAIGMKGGVTSRHYSHIKCDDLVGLEADRSPAEMAFAISWVQQIEPLLTGERDYIDFIGTRWSLVDVYGVIQLNYGDMLQTFSRMATDTGEPDGIPIFPEEFSREKFELIKRMNPKQWAAQYCNNPVGDGSRDFDIRSVRTYRFNDRGDIEFADAGTTKSWPVEALYITVQVDPNSGKKTAPDTAAIIVTGVSPDDEVFTLDAFSGRPSPSELVDLAFERACAWNAAVIGVEEAGQQNTLFYLEKLMMQKNRYFRVEPLKHMNKEKEQRIRQALDPVIRQGRLFVPERFRVLRSSIENFPQIPLWDEIDALAYGPQLWQLGTMMEKSEARENRIKLITESRGRTGYGGSVSRPLRRIR